MYSIARLAMGLVLIGTTALHAQQAGLKIVVIAGEDAINIIQQRTAVAPIVQVRDRNDQPVAGLAVLFLIRGKGAEFPGGVQTVTVTTDTTGQAAAPTLTPLTTGAVEIRVQATYQGQTAEVTIKQTNIRTAADATGGAKKGGVPTGVLIAGLGAAGGGLWYAKKTMDENAAFLEEFGNITTTTSGSGNNPTTNVPTGARAFDGTYRALVTRGCTPGGSGATPCNHAIQVANCSPTNFTFTVSNGVISDCGPWFGRGSVAADGSYSGIYNGSGNGVPIRGNFPRPNGAGTFTISGSGNSGGAQYTTTIQVTKQ